MIEVTKNSGSNELRSTTVSGKHVHRLDIIDILSLLYVVSFYTLINNEELSWISIVLASLMLGILLFRHLFAGPLSFPRLFWAPWLFVAFNIVSLLWSRDSVRAIEEIEMISSAVIGAAAIWLAMHNGTSVKPIVYGLMIGSIILIVSGISEISDMGNGARISGLAGNPNSVALYMSYPFMLVWCIRDKTIGRLRLPGIGLVIFAFLYTGTRKVVVVLGVLLSFLLIYFVSNINWRGMWKRLGLIFLSIIATMLLLAMVWSQDWTLWIDRASVFLSTNEVVVRFLNIARDEQVEGSSVSLRSGMTKVALKLWAESPIVGHGSGQFVAIGGFGLYTHNNYVELLANLGIVGLGLYYILPMTMFVSVLRSLKKLSRNIPFWSNILVVIIAMFVLDLAMVTLTSKAHWVFLVVMMTIIEKEERIQVSGYHESDQNGHRFHQRLL